MFAIHSVHGIGGSRDRGVRQVPPLYFSEKIVSAKTFGGGRSTSPCLEARVLAGGTSSLKADKVRRTVWIASPTAPATLARGTQAHHTFHQLLGCGSSTAVYRLDAIREVVHLSHKKLIATEEILYNSYNL